MSKVKHEIAVTARNEFGNNAARRARNNGLVPVNVYAKGKANRNFFVKDNEWDILSKEDFSVLYLINGKEKIAAVVKEVQKNYLKSYVVHIDMNEINMNDVTHAMVKIVAVGEAAGVSRGGVLEQLQHEVELVGTPAALPDALEVSVAALEVGGSISVKDLAFPAGVTAKSDGDLVVFHVVAPTKEAEATEEA